MESPTTMQAVQLSTLNSIHLAIATDDVEASISGSGDIRLEGEEDDLEGRVSGSGDYECFAAEFSDVAINISGSGDAELFVTDKFGKYAALCAPGLSIWSCFSVIQEII